MQVDSVNRLNIFTSILLPSLQLTEDSLHVGYIGHGCCPPCVHFMVKVEGWVELQVGLEHLGAVGCKAALGVEVTSTTQGITAGTGRKVKAVDGSSALVLRWVGNFT